MWGLQGGASGLKQEQGRSLGLWDVCFRCHGFLFVSELRSLREKEVGVPRTRSCRWPVVVLCDLGGALVVSVFFPGLLIRCPKQDLINQVLQVNFRNFSSGGRVAKGCWPT